MGVVHGASEIAQLDDISLLLFLIAIETQTPRVETLRG